MKRLFFIFSLVFSMKMLVFGQIGKGVYTFEPTLLSSLLYNSKSFTPSFGGFVTSKLLIEGGYSRSKYITSGPGYFKITNGGNLKLTYFFSGKNIVKPYISVAFGKEYSSSVSYIKALSTTDVSRRQYGKTSISIGGQYFLNKNLVLDSRLVFERDNKYFLNRNQLLITLKPYFDASSFKEASQVNDFLYEGKIMINGSFDIENIHYAQREKANNFANGSINVAYARNKHFLFGADIQFEKQRDYSVFTFVPNFAYYFHLQKRLYFVTDFAAGMDYIDFAVSVPFYDRFNLKMQAGCSFDYFINKQTAAYFGAYLSSSSFLRHIESVTNPEDYFLRTGLKYFLN